MDHNQPQDTHPDPLKMPTPPPTGNGASESTSEPFTPLEEAPPFQEIPAPVVVEPFSGEEIVSGTAMILALGLRFQTPEEANAFTSAFRQGIVPMLPPAAVLDALKVGEALARYGIGRNALPGVGNLAALPDWLRLLLGGLVLAVSAYGGINAAREVNVDMAGPVGPTAPAPA